MKSLYLKNKIDPVTIDSLADFICGDNLEKYPEYRSSFYLTKFFNNIGINDEHDGSTRKWWVVNVLKNLDLNNLEKVILRLVDLKEYKADVEKLRKAILAMNGILIMEGLKIEYIGNNVSIVEIDQVNVEKILESGTNEPEKYINLYKDKKLIEIDRKKHLDEFTLNDFHFFKCPKCKQGYLEIDRETFESEMTQGSKEAYELTNEISLCTLLFHCYLRCNNKKCQSLHVMSGEGRTEEHLGYDEDGMEMMSYPEFYAIKYIDPSLNIIEISEKIPSDIKATLEESFLFFWIDCSSAGNKIRKSLEIIMDNLNIDKGNLHTRIKKFGEKYRELSEMLMGVKWLGNFGSHEDGLTRDDLLDAYEVLDYVLHDLFLRDKYFDQIKRKASNLTKKYKK